MTRDDTIPLPQGYEPHELPPDYTGKLWIEGQMRQYAALVATAAWEAAQADITRMRVALDNAADDIEYWGNYASEYVKKKHDLQKDIDDARAAMWATGVQS